MCSPPPPACPQHKDVLETSLAQLKGDNERNIGDVRRIRQREVLLKEVRPEVALHPAWPHLLFALLPCYLVACLPACLCLHLSAATGFAGVLLVRGLPFCPFQVCIYSCMLPALAVFAVIVQAGGGDSDPGALVGV